MFDVSAVEGVQAGDVVTLLGQAGEHLFTADQWAEMAQTISWEILCGFKHRLPRITATKGGVRSLQASISSASV